MGFLSAGTVALFGVGVCLAQEGSLGFPTLCLGTLLGMGKGSEF